MKRKGSQAKAILLTIASCFVFWQAISVVWTNAATATLRLDYPLYQGTARLPAAVADWIFQQQGLITCLNNLVRNTPCANFDGDASIWYIIWLPTRHADTDTHVGASGVISTDAASTLADGDTQGRSFFCRPNMSSLLLVLACCVYIHICLVLLVHVRLFTSLAFCQMSWKGPRSAQQAYAILLITLYLNADRLQQVHFCCCFFVCTGQHHSALSEECRWRICF